MTEPLALRPLRVADAAEMAEVLADPELYRFTGGEPPSAADLKRRYTAQTRGRSGDGTEVWLNHVVVAGEDAHAVGYVQATIPADPAASTVEADGGAGPTVAGDEGIVPSAAADEEGPPTVAGDGGVAEIAWVIGRPWHGRGYATRAAALLLHHLRERGVTDIVAHIHPDHVASCCVAQRLGMSPTDVVVDGEVRWVGAI